MQASKDNKFSQENNTEKNFAESLKNVLTGALGRSMIISFAAPSTKGRTRPKLFRCKSDNILGAQVLLASPLPAFPHSPRKRHPQQMSWEMKQPLVDDMGLQVFGTESRLARN